MQHYGITQNQFTALKIPRVPPVPPSLPLAWATTVLTVSIVLPFQNVLGLESSSM